MPELWCFVIYSIKRHKKTKPKDLVSKISDPAGIAYGDPAPKKLRSFGAGLPPICRKCCEQAPAWLTCGIHEGSVLTATLSLSSIRKSVRRTPDSFGEDLSYDRSKSRPANAIARLAPGLAAARMKISTRMSVFTVWPSLLSLARVKPRLAERPRDVNDIIRILWCRLPQNLHTYHIFENLLKKWEQ